MKFINNDPFLLMNAIDCSSLITILYSCYGLNLPNSKRKLNVALNFLKTTQDGVSVLVCPVILWTHVIMVTKTMADVMPCCCIGRWYALADVIAI